MKRFFKYNFFIFVFTNLLFRVMKDRVLRQKNDGIVTLGRQRLAQSLQEFILFRDAKIV